MTTPPDEPGRPEDSEAPASDDRPVPGESASSGWDPSAGQMGSYVRQPDEKGQPGSGVEQRGYGPPPVYGQPEGYGDQPPYGQAQDGLPACGQQPPSGQPAYGQPAYGPAPGVSTGTEPKAIIALVLSILGFACCGVFGIAGVVLGYLARRDIAASGGAKTGDGLALAAMIIGGLAIVVGIGFGIYGFSSGGGGNPFVPGY